MGLVLDSTVAIAAERKRLPVESLLAGVRSTCGSVEIALSVISVMELEHGIWRARDEDRAALRRQFLEDLIRSVPVYPIGVELVRRAGRVDAERQGAGVRIAMADLLIGVSALELGYSVLTLNVRHFHMIPGLHVVPVNL
jgi:predicted nucleic acid-binding protein